MMGKSIRQIWVKHFSRDLVNVNEWKIMFDPSIGEVEEFATVSLEQNNKGINQIGLDFS